MKKHLSIFALIVRCSIYPVLLVIGLMSVSQVVLFYLNQGPLEATLIDALGAVPFRGILSSAMVFICILLCRSMCDQGGRMNNLVLRLGVSEKMIFLWQCVYNFLVFAQFYMVQALVFLLISCLYAVANPGTVSPMGLLVASYGVDMFHTYFPLENIPGWVTAIVLLLSLAICCAAYPVRQRHRCQSISTWFIVLLWVGYLYLQSESGYGYLEGVATFYTLPVALICVFFAIYGVTSLEVDDDGKA